MRLDMTRMDYLAARLGRLADTLSTLRERVRAAVATELGKAVGQAAQDVLEAFARGRPALPAEAPPPRHAAASDWDAAEPDPWDDDDSVAARRVTAVTAAPTTWTGRVARAGAAAAAAWRWCRHARGPAWLAAAVGAAAAAAAWADGPLLSSVAAAVTAAAELLFGGPAL